MRRMHDCAIVWFRHDLRLTDNAALAAAAAGGRPVVPVYVLDCRPGAAARWWLHHSLGALDDALQALGSRLLIRKGTGASVLADLVRETGAKSVHWHRAYSPVGRAEDAAVSRALEACGVEGVVHAGTLMHEPATTKPYRVFTPFWRALSASFDPGPVLAPPARLTPPQAWPDGIALEALDLLPRVRWDKGLAAAWTPGEQAALQRLEAFCGGTVADYHVQRDFPATAGVSRLSPHLHFGEISPRQAWHAAHRAGPGAGADAWLRQLWWREFAHTVLYHYPETVNKPLQTKFADFPWRDDDGTLFRAWAHGQTGFPLVDAGMRELWHTGWMHNRVRMVVASFLVKNLRLPWQAGAGWFMDTLVDADAANNTLGWQWAAGCGADAAPYFRIFNPQRQQQRFDPDEAYVRRWIPEYGSAGYAEPMVDFRTSRTEALDALKRISR